MDRRAQALVVGAALLIGFGALARLHHRRRTGAWFGGEWTTTGWFETEDTAPRAFQEGEPPDAATVAWCADGLAAVPGGGCYAAPRGDGPWPLILYLHGIFEPLAASDELDRQSRVASRAVRRGFAVLALRGHVGQCSAPEYATRVCWPSNERNEGAGPSYVDEWRAPLAAAKRLGATGNRYVLGFSNGGYFSGLLAQRGWFSARAFVVARGGPVEPVHGPEPKPPILLTFSEGDPSHDEMMKLADDLTRDAWAHDQFASQGGHALPDMDIDAALDFFRKHEAR